MKNLLFNFMCAMACFACQSDKSFNAVAPNSGKGGSLARFTIVGDNLYTVNENKLNAFSIDNDQNLSKKSSQEIDAFAETIFPFKNHLLLGTRTGMFVYSLVNPDKPVFASRYTHMASCDPVVAAGDFAYVTLRSGSPCQRGNNQLDVLNISNLNAPQFINSIQLKNPHGLSIANNSLLVCEKDFGLSIFDISSPEKVVKFKSIADIKAFDAITNGNRVIFTGVNGISQYLMSDNAEFQLLSQINLNE